MVISIAGVAKMKKDVREFRVAWISLDVPMAIVVSMHRLNVIIRMIAVIIQMKLLAVSFIEKSI